VEIVPIFKSGRACLQKDGGSIYYINLSQDEFTNRFFVCTNVEYYGKDAPTIKDAAFFKRAFNTIQELILRQNSCWT
jgi:phosphoribosylformylglycinamidine synthase